MSASRAKSWPTWAGSPLARRVLAPGTLPDWVETRTSAARARAAFQLWFQAGVVAWLLYLTAAAAFAAWPDFRWPGLAYDAPLLAEWTDPDTGWAGRAAAFVRASPVVMGHWLSLGLLPWAPARLPNFFWGFAVIVCFNLMLVGLVPSAIPLRASEAGFWHVCVLWPACLGLVLGLGEPILHPASRRPSRACHLALAFEALALAFGATALAVDRRLALFAVVSLGGWFGPAYYRIPLVLAYSVVFRLKPPTFADNPYRFDAAVRLPLPAVRRRLLALAARAPDEARAFAAFLRAERPLQADLAKALERAAGAGR